MQNVSATDMILGRDTADAGVIEEISPANVRTMINVEDGATADQSGAEIKTAYEAEANAYTDTKDTKLSGIALSANNYSHPTSAGNKHIPSGGSSGQFLKYSSSGTATWASDNNDNTTYTAGGDYGMTLSSTEFRLEDDRRRNSSSTDIYSGNTHDYTFYDANVGIRWYTANAEEMRLEDDGDLHVDGDVIAYSTTVSDATLKYNINPVEFALDKIQQLKGVTFNYFKDDKASAGLLAQDVEKVMPSAVSKRKIPLHTDDDKSYKTLHYDSVTAILVEAIKELTAKVEKLEIKDGHRK
jgi:hypothetical protein